MPTAVTLERFVGPAIHVHGEGRVVLHEAAFAASSVVPGHVHADPVISLVLAGGGVEEVGARVRPIETQDLLFTPSYALHGYRFAGAGRWFNMQLTDEWLTRVTDGVALPTASQIVRGGSTAVWAARVRTEVRQRDSVSNVAIDGALLLMVADLARSRVDAARRRPRWLHVVEDALAASPGEPPTIDTLAELAGVNATHLLRTFRRHHGATIANFARRRRVEWARAELARAKRPLSAIALEAGFADQSHFTRVFRQTFGETPGQYARALRSR